METKQYGVWFAAGAIGSLVALMISSLMTAASASSSPPMLAGLLLWVSLGLSIVAIVALSGFMSAVMDHMSETRNRR